MKDKIIAELDRRIENINQGIVWRKKLTDEYFAAFKSYVAVSLTPEGVASGHINDRIEEIRHSYTEYAKLIVARDQMIALRKDIENGRVEFDV